MPFKTRRFAHVLGLVSLAGLPLLANAEIVTFEPSEVNLGQGGDGSYRTSVAGSEWSSFGISLSGVSLYTSPFDPIDGVGIVGDSSAGPGVIAFLSPVSAVTLAVLQAPFTDPSIVRAFRPDGSLLEERSLAAVNDTTLTNVLFDGTVGHIEFLPADFTAISTVAFTSVPAPGAFGAASVLLGLAGSRRRR